MRDLDATVKSSRVSCCTAWFNWWHCWWKGSLPCVVPGIRLRCTASGNLSVYIIVVVWGSRGV